MRHLVPIVTIGLIAGIAFAAPIRSRPATDEPPLAGQTLSIELNADGELVLPRRASPDLKMFLEGQVIRIKKVAVKDKTDFAPVLQVKVHPDMPFRSVVEVLGTGKLVGFENIKLGPVNKR